MGCYSSRSCHLCLVGGVLSVAVCSGHLKGWFGHLHAVMLGRSLMQCCLQGCGECDVFGGLWTVHRGDCI